MRAKAEAAATSPGTAAPRDAVALEAWQDTRIASSSRIAMETNSRRFKSAKNSAPSTNAPIVKSVRPPRATAAASASPPDQAANRSRSAPRPEAFPTA